MAGPRAPGLKNEPIDLTFSDSDESPKPAPPSLPNFPDVINVTSGEEQAEPRSGEEENSHVHVKEEDGGPSKRHRETDVSGSPSKPKKFRQTARKSAHHPNHALARRVWAEASAAKEDDSTDGETHETAMQKAAAERRRSSAGKSRTPSPVKPNAVAGPGPKSSAQSQRFIVVDDDSPPESVASRPGSSASHRRASKPARGTPVADPPAAAAIRKSAFSATEEPGSWGNAVPMGSQRPKSKPATPVSRVQTSSPAPALGDWGNAAPMSIGKSVVRQEVPAAPASSTSQLAPASSSTAFEAPSSPSALATADSVANPRKGPTWTTSAPVTEAVAPVSERVPTPPVGQVQTVDMPDVMAEADNGPIPGPAEGSLVAETADIEAASPAPVVDIGVTPTAAPVPVEVGASPTDSVMEVDPDSETVVDLPHLAGNDATIDVEIEADLPLANTTYERLEQAIESIEDGVHDVAIDRDTRSQSSSSIEAIPEEVARTQACFAARPVVEVQPSTGTATVLDLFRNSPNPPRRPRLSANTTRQPSASSSSSGSPSKRQSSRLSSKSIQKSIQPVYSFKRNTYNPVQWRHVIEMDGESLPEDSSSAGSTRPSSIELLGTTVDGARMFKVTAFVETPTPIDRLSQAIRIPDTRLIDEWNKQAPSMTNNHALHRMIFESYIDMSVGGAEPTIGVDNTVDEEQIPPRFEFQYSNEMLYHKDVPDPELGKGCGCDGPCSDKSNSCSCLARQALYNYDVIDGFAYDKKGILKNSTGIPIWECGPNCGCPPECMNRVVQRGRSNSTVVDLFKTKKKGWGIRARHNIPKGTFLGVYSGELITDEESERRGVLYSKTGRTYLFDCQGFHIHSPPEGLAAVDPRLAELAAAAKSRADVERAEAIDMGDYVAEEFVYNAYSVDAYHRGFTRYFNHSCDPNLVITQAYAYDFHPERPLLAVFTRQDVRAGEELCISYKGVPDEEEEIVVPQRNGKIKKSKKTMAHAHVTKKNKKKAQKDPCYCGAWNCDGAMFGLDRA